MSSEDVAVDVGEHQAEQQPVQMQQEKMVPQSEVDKIVHARIMREREHSNMGMGGIQQPAFDEEAIIAKATQRLQQHQDEQRKQYELEQQKAQVDEIAKTYLDKMSQGKEIYPDFDETTADFSPGAYPQVTILASQQDNLPDIIYELSKNPQKLTHLHVLALTNPQQARKEMTKLSQSIKKNDEALANNSKSPAPLSRLKPSARAGQDTGKRTISDMRKDPKYRG
jgi:hypothetical protein